MTAWLGLYADLDKGIPVDDVEQLRTAAATSSQPTEIVRYADAEHGFNCDRRASYQRAVGNGRVGSHARLVRHLPHEGGVMDNDVYVESMPFAKACGVEIESATKDEVRGGLAWSPERCTTGGGLHGGLLMALADSLGAVCAFLNLPPGAGTSTIESKTNFFRGVRDGRVSATSRPLHVGRTTIVLQTDIRDEQDRRVALVTQTQMVLQ